MGVLQFIKMKRDEIVTYVSTCDFQEQSNKANQVQMKYSNLKHMNTWIHMAKQY